MISIIGIELLALGIWFLVEIYLLGRAFKLLEIDIAQAQSRICRA